MTDRTTLTAPDGTTYDVPNGRLARHHNVRVLHGFQWTMEHPITCDLRACPVHEAAASGFVPMEKGTYRAHVGDAGIEYEEADGE